MHFLLIARPALAGWLVLVCCATAAPRPALSQHGHAPARALDSATWREDLRTLAVEIRRLHPDPFAVQPEARFDSAVAALDARIPGLDPAGIATGFLSITALVEDGHTGAIAMLPPFGFTRFYPVRMTVEEDRLHVVAAAPEHRALVGGRVVTLGRLPAAEALARVLTVCSGDNHFSRIDRAPIFLMSPGVLRALGIVGKDETLALVVETPGPRPRHVSAGVVAVEPEEGRYPAFFQDPEGLPVAAGVSFRDGAAQPPPLHLRDPDRAWWFETLPGRRTVYLMLRRVDREDQGRTFARFVDGLFAHVDSIGAEYLVIDLRHNGGGDNTILQPLIHGLIRRAHTIGRPGHLYTIIGRETFSAAMNCANWIEEHTRARFVGEPTGARPNHFGDATTVRLPNSGMPVRISRYRWSARLPWDDRPWIAPHLPAPPAMATAHEHRDPALEAILAEIEQGPMTVRLRAALEAGRLDEARGIYFRSKEERPDRWGRTTVRETTDMARALFEGGHAEAAFALAGWNTELYPEIAEVWITLGAGYVMAGRSGDAVAPLRRALELDPGNESARRWLERAEDAKH